MNAVEPARVALVSGGSRGLGLALVERMLGQGLRVATFSRSGTAEIDALCDKYGDDFHWRSADLADPAAMRQVVADVVDRFGRLDVLVNNAGVLHQELFLTIAPHRVEELIAANVVAPILLAQAAARAMTRSRTGVIVNVSSINAIRGFRGVAVYAAAKAALDGFGRSLARELGPVGIRVNSVVPGFFETEMTAGVTEHNRERIQRRTPLGRLASVGEVADATLYLISPQASFVTGQTLVVDGGITC